MEQEIKKNRLLEIVHQKLLIPFKNDENELRGKIIEIGISWSFAKKEYKYWIINDDAGRIYITKVQYKKAFEYYQEQMSAELGKCDVDYTMLLDL